MLPEKKGGGALYQYGSHFDCRSARDMSRPKNFAMNQKSLNGKTGEFLSQNKNQMTIKRGGGGGGEVKVKLTITTYIS